METEVEVITVDGEASVRPVIIYRRGLNDDQVQMMREQKGLFLCLDHSYVFDLEAWYLSDSRNNRFPSMPKKRLELFYEDVQTSGVLVMPVLAKGTFEVVDGRTRLTALYLARAKGYSCQFPGFIVRAFADKDEIHDFQDQVQFGIRTLSRAQKREKIAEALQRHPDWADNRIGVFLQVDGDTVGSVSQKLEAEGRLTRPIKRLGLDGRYTSANPKKNSPEKNSESASACESSPLIRMLRRWRDEKGVYPVHAREVAQLMAIEGLALDDGTVLAQDNLQKQGRKVGKWLSRKVKEGISVEGWYLYKREFGYGQAIYGLVPDKLRKLELESTDPQDDEAADESLEA